MLTEKLNRLRSPVISFKLSGNELPVEATGIEGISSRMLEKLGRVSMEIDVIFSKINSKRNKRTS